MKIVTRPGDAPIDVWSLAHLATGFALGVLSQKWWLAFALVAGFELFEAVMRRVKRHGAGIFEYESWPNIIADIAIGMLGWYATAWWIPIPDAWRLL